MDNKQTTQPFNVVYTNAPANADKFMTRVEGCIKDISFSRAVDELLPPFVLGKKMDIVKACFDEITESHGAASWRWVVIVQWLRDMSILIKSAWVDTEKKGIEIGETAKSVLKQITSELDSLYCIVEANVLANKEVQKFHDDCVISGSLDGELVHNVVNPQLLVSPSPFPPPPVLDDDDDDDEKTPEPEVKRSRFIGGAKDEEQAPESQDPTSEVPTMSPPHSPIKQVCPDAPRREKPESRIRRVYVIDDDVTYTTLTLSFP